jgi:hypothetical protein
MVSPISPPFAAMSVQGRDQVRYLVSGVVIFERRFLSRQRIRITSSHGLAAIGSLQMHVVALG